MTDIKAFQAEAFLKCPPTELCAVLFYGPDLGLVSERSQAFAAALAADPKSPGDILRINDADLAADPDRLSIELRTVSMFGGRKIIRLQSETRLRPDLIADLIAPETTLEGFLIVEAGELKGDSKVRALFAASAKAAAVACTGDEAADLSGMLDAMLTETGNSLAPDARDTLLELLGADRVLSRAEVQKLLIYAGPGTTISEADVTAIVGDAAEMVVDDVISAAFTGHVTEALRQGDRAIASGEAPQSVMLAIQRHVLRLHAVRGALDQGRNADAAFKGLRPPAFGKSRDALSAQCRIWSLAAADRALALTHTAIAASRHTGADDRGLCEHLLIDVARLATAGRRT